MIYTSKKLNYVLIIIKVPFYELFLTKVPISWKASDINHLNHKQLNKDYIPYEIRPQPLLDYIFDDSHLHLLKGNCSLEVSIY